jgi:transcription elongation factor Elf1
VKLKFLTLFFCVTGFLGAEAKAANLCAQTIDCPQCDEGLSTCTLVYEGTTYSSTVASCAHCQAKLQIKSLLCAAHPEVPENALDGAFCERVP